MCSPRAELRILRLILNINIEVFIIKQYIIYNIIVHTCILGRMCFVERSIGLIEEQSIILDRSSGFRNFIVL